MTEGVKHGLIFIVMSAITLAFCLLLYPPIAEKLKNLIQLKEQKNYDNAKVYGDITEALRDIISANVLTALWYVLYFFIATQYLVSRFGAFAYGDNDETFIYLIWVGIPYVASYLHFVLRAGNYQAALKKSNFKNKENDSKVFWYTFYTPMILFIVVQKIFQFSTKYPDKNIILSLMGIK
ncbi:MAG: hypothetical protein PHP95_17075 [Desulfuromonadaceae bacterium]|nr:hypothetical protein [Desulfuromonadaceae bacterium]MDD2850162.1 hypothetical protein [Desulfuromonadaceae bacterium]MDD4130988.1 hypothetical protein [Desulfuromonadaceae bacterium]